MSVRTKTTQIFCFPTFIVTLKGQWPNQLSFFRQSNQWPRSLKQIAFLFHLGAGLGVSPNDFLEPYWNLLTQSVLVVNCAKLNMKYSKVMSRWHRRGGVQMPFRISIKKIINQQYNRKPRKNCRLVSGVWFHSGIAIKQTKIWVIL